MSPHQSYKLSKGQQKRVQNLHPQELNDMVITRSGPQHSVQDCACTRRGSLTLTASTCAAITGELVFCWFVLRQHSFATRVKILFTRGTAVPQLIMFQHTEEWVTDVSHLIIRTIFTNSIQSSTLQFMIISKIFNPGYLDMVIYSISMCR